MCVVVGAVLYWDAYIKVYSPVYSQVLSTYTALHWILFTRSALYKPLTQQHSLCRLQYHTITHSQTHVARQDLSQLSQSRPEELLIELSLS